MNPKLIVLLPLALFSASIRGQPNPDAVKSQIQSAGEGLFQTTCTACHTINRGRLIGPDLSRVYERREEDWLIRFIRSSQKMHKAGDSLAVALYKEYNQVPMPDNQLTDQEIKNLIDYIRETDNGVKEIVSTGRAAADSAAITETLFSEEQWRQGYALFYGKESFANGPVSCFGCHSMNDRYTMIGGGKLSTNLSGTYGKLGQAGIQAILLNPPFPVMKAALEGKNLTEEEVEALTAMFQFADQQLTNHPPVFAGTFVLVIFAFVFALFFVVHLYLIYSNRKLPS
jgi:mono/diheme cytochrome c family protein